MLQNWWAPKRNRSEIFISRKVWFSIHCNYSIPHSVNHAVVLTYAANATLDRSGNLWSERTRDYSKKFSSMVTTHFDEGKTSILDNGLRSFTRFVYISAFFIRKRQQWRRSWRIYTQSALRAAAQGSQHTIGYTHGDKWISIVHALRSYFRLYPKFTFCGEWVVHAETVTIMLHCPGVIILASFPSSSCLVHMTPWLCGGGLLLINLLLYIFITD